MRGVQSRLKGLLDAAEQRTLGTVTCFMTQEPIAALTFDDGPHPEFTPLFLEVLERYQARATFFMVGEAAARYPEIVRQVKEAGHAIGNHSWDHPSFPLASSLERRRQIRACEGAIGPHAQRIFRPPFGHQDRKSRLDAWRLGYQVVTWSVIAMDWLDHDGVWLADRVESQIEPGSIILFHDSLYTIFQQSYADRSATLQAVELLLQRMKDRFCFVTIPQLFEQARPHLENWRQAPRKESLRQLREADGKPWRYASSV